MKKKKNEALRREILFHEIEHVEKYRFWWRKGQDKGRHFEFESNLRRCREWSEGQVCGLYRV